MEMNNCVQIIGWKSLLSHLGSRVLGSQLGVWGKASVPSLVKVNSISPVSALQAHWEISLRSEWQLSPVLLPRSHGQRAWQAVVQGHRESDTTEATMPLQEEEKL